MSQDLKSLSKRSFNINSNAVENIQVSALMRIADATEAMAKNYLQLQDNLERYKKWYVEECNRGREKDRAISNMRGQITKMKNKLKTITNE